MKAIKIICRALEALAGVYIAAGVYYLLHGGFAFNFIFSVRVVDFEKPGYILALALALRLALFLFTDIGAPSIFTDGRLARLFANRSRLWILAFIISLTVIIRLWGLGQGLAWNAYHPDESKQGRSILFYLNGNYTFDLGFVGNRYMAGYPYFGMHFPEFALRAVALRDSFTGRKSEAPEKNDGIMAGRYLNVLYTVGIVVLIWLVGARLGRENAALMASLFFAVSLIQNDMTKYLCGDLPRSFFSMIGFYLAMLNLEKEKYLYYALSGAFIGLAFASKYNGMLMFIPVFFLFLTLRENIRDVVVNSPKILSGVAAAVFVYIITSADFLTDPVATFDIVRKAGEASSNFYVPPDRMDMAGHLKLLYEWGAYNWWVFTGIFAPLPIWIALPAIGYAIYRTSWRYVYLWAPPLLIFLIGKITMPISAAGHFLDVIPFVMLSAAIGMEEAAVFVKSGKIKKILIVALGAYLVWTAAQHNSFWTLKPVQAEQYEWTRDNIAHGIKPVQVGLIAVENAPKEALERRIHFFTDGMPQPYSLHRGERKFLWTVSDEIPVAHPVTHFPSQKAVSYVLPGSWDFVTTEKIFATGWSQIDGAERYILAGDAADPVILWMKNYSRKDNRIRGTFGKRNFDYKLGPGETRILSASKNDTTFLYYGKYIYLSVMSEEGAGFAIGATEEDKGDIYMEAGDMDSAMRSYIKSGTMNGELMAIMNARNAEEKKTALAGLLAVRRNIFSQDYDPADPAMWKKLAGYKNGFYEPMMSRPVEKNRGNNAVKASDDWLIFDGGYVYGPYIPLARGDYEVGAIWRADKADIGFTLDAVVMSEGKVLGQVSAKTDAAGRGETKFTFRVDRLLEYPVEIRVMNVSGGMIYLEDFRIRADNRKTMAGILAKAKEAAKGMIQ